MYILFDTRLTFVPAIISKITEWCHVNNVQCRHKRGVDGLRVTFDDDRIYTVFAMTWNPDNDEIYRFRLVEPMKTRQPR